MASILVVDDDSVSQRMLSYTLEKNGHLVNKAWHGVEALQYLREKQYDLAIVDMTMPVMDGLTLLNLLRSDEQLRTLPVIMLTASGENEAHAAAQAQGANVILTKPTGSRELLATVAQLLHG